MTGAADLDQILKTLRQAETDFNIASDEEKLCEDEQQDILHELELVRLSYHERGKLAARLVEVRKKRRQAKNALETLEPLVNWLKENQDTVRSLQRVLGEMRKQEQRHLNRVYVKRVDGEGAIIEFDSKK